jgi:hypothetical protein
MGRICNELKKNGIEGTQIELKLDGRVALKCICILKQMASESFRYQSDDSDDGKEGGAEYTAPACFRTKTHKPSKLGPEGEYALVLQEGGPGITEALELGHGITVPPLADGERLFQFNTGKCQTAGTGLAKIAKEANARFGHNNTSENLVWVNQDGTIKPLISDFQSSLQHSPVEMADWYDCEDEPQHELEDDNDKLEDNHKITRSHDHDEEMLLTLDGEVPALEDEAQEIQREPEGIMGRLPSLEEMKTMRFFDNFCVVVLVGGITTKSKIFGLLQSLTSATGITGKPIRADKEGGAWWASMKLVGKSSKTAIVRKYKVAVAGTDPKNIEFLIIFDWLVQRAKKLHPLKFKSTNRKVRRDLVRNLAQEIIDVCPDDIERLELEDHHLSKAVTYLIDIKIVDFDITIDCGGTMYGPQIRQNMEDNDILEKINDKSSKNCISSETTDIGNGMTKRQKVYDKVNETMEQGTVAATIGDKAGMLLNPSMPGLRRDMIKYQSVGVIRSVVQSIPHTHTYTDDASCVICL